MVINSQLKGGKNKMTQVRIKPHLRKKPHSSKKIRVKGSLREVDGRKRRK